MNIRPLSNNNFNAHILENFEYKEMEERLFGEYGVPSKDFADFYVKLNDLPDANIDIDAYEIIHGQDHVFGSIEFPNGKRKLFEFKEVGNPAYLENFYKFLEEKILPKKK